MVNDKYKKGIIFDIKRYAIHDGPGIRTTIFFKGCPLRCLWCCNPESQEINPEISFTPDRCIKCGWCERICPKQAIKLNRNKVEIDRKRCVRCGLCSQNCPSNALEIIGKYYTINELMQEVEKDNKFYSISGGGVTVSGGECTMQSEFLLKFLKECKQKYIHIALDTCGYVKSSIFQQLIKYVDLILFDIKEMNAEKHKEYTNKSNKLILENLKIISSSNLPTIIRFPIIPGYNDTKENIELLISFITGLKYIREIDLLPYHRLGESKYVKLGRKYNFRDVQPPDNETIQRVKKLLESSLDLKINIGG